MKSLLFLLTLVFAGMTASAQSVTLNDVKWSEFRYVRPIEDKGYWVIYEGEKLKKGKKEYHVIFYDYDLNVIKDQVLSLSRSMVLLDGGYNGEFFFAMFYEWIKGSPDGFTFYTFNQEGEEIAHKTLARKSFTYNVYSAVGSSIEVFPADDGFYAMFPIMKGAKGGYDIIKFDESVKQEWRKTVMPKKGINNVMTATDAHGQLAVVVAKKPKMLSREFNWEVSLFSSSDGKEIFNYDLTDTKLRIATSLFIDEDGSVIVGGNYIDGVKFKGSPDGVFFTKIGPDGKKVSESLEDWDAGIGKKVKANSKKGLLASKPFLMFQTVEKSADGDYLVVGETYYNAISKMGTALNVLAVATGGETNNAIDIIVEDFVVLQFDGSTGQLEAVSMIDKFKSTYTVDGQYAGFLGAFYLDQAGLFDYVYTQDDEAGNPVLVYTDYDKSSREEQGLDKSESKSFIGFANIADVSDVQVSKHNLARKARIRDWVIESKPGSYLMVAYDKKEKTLSMSVEALSGKSE
jgi:hypothetical protein